MKWYKHISDSLDDPFIYELMEEFGSDGYLTFFGILEIYSREFSPENEWKLNIKLSYFHKKLLISSSKIKKILSKIYKWEVSFSGEYVSIFIPKFKDLLDEWTLRKLNQKKNDSGVNRELIGFKDKDTDKEKEKNKEKYSSGFLSFWKTYPKKSGSKKAAFSEWKKLNGTLPPIETIIEAITKQTEWRTRAGPSDFRPEWKDPERWIKGRMWEAEIEITERTKDDLGYDL